MLRWFLVAAVIALAGLAHAGGGSSQADTVTYQGRFTDNGASANGDYEFRFRVWDAATSGTMLDESTTVLTVVNGLFNAELPFGDDINGSDAFIEIGARLSGSMGAFTALGSRQAVTAAPRAAFAHRAGLADGVSGPLALGEANVESGSLEIFNAGSGQAGVEVVPSGTGHSLRAFDLMGDPSVILEPDTDGTGHFLRLDGDGGLLVFDGQNLTGGPTLSLTGPSDTIRFAPASALADDKVSLPASSITAVEIGDEPGVAASLRPNVVSPIFLSTIGFTSVNTQSMVCPGPGYVIAIANLGLATTRTLLPVTNEITLSTDGSTSLTGRIARQVVDTDTLHTNTCSLTEVIAVDEGFITVSLLAKTNRPNVATFGTPNELTLLYVPTAYGAVSARGVADGPLSGVLLGGASHMNDASYERLQTEQHDLKAEMAAMRQQLEAVLKQQAQANGR